MHRLRRAIWSYLNRDPTPLPWRKLQQCSTSQTIVILGLDGVDKPDPLPILCNRLARELCSEIAEEPIYQSTSWTFYMQTLRPAPYFTLCSWEVGGGRKWIKDEQAMLRLLMPTVVFLVDGADNDRMVEAREECSTALRCSADGIPLLVLVTNGISDNVRRVFEPFAANQREIRLAPVHLETGEGLLEAWSWIVEAVQRYDRRSVDEAVRGKYGRPASAQVVVEKAG